MKREAIADKAILTAKKRYMLNVYDNEGVRYTEPKLKMMGIEAIKSSTPQACRDSIKKAIRKDTKAVMIVHVGGIVSDEITKILKKEYNYLKEQSEFQLDD